MSCEDKLKANAAKKPDAKPAKCEGDGCSAGPAKPAAKRKPIGKRF